jgi:tetratricopeptide (TPR) repeat protein
VAEANFRKARQAVDEQFTLVSQSKLFDTPGFQSLRKDLLKSALRYYEGFLQQRPDDPELQVEVAAAYFRLFQVYENVESEPTAEALVAFEKGISLVEESLRAHPEDFGPYRRLAGFAKGSRLLHTAYNRMSEPLPDPLRSIALFARAIPIWEQFVREDQTVIGFLMDLSYLHYYSGEFLAAAGRFNEALTSAQKALALREQVVRAAPNIAEYRAELAQSHDLLALRLGEASRPEEVEAHVRQALDLRRRLVEEQPEVPEYAAALALSHHYLGSQLAESGRLAEARQNYLEAVRREEKLVAEFANVPYFRSMLARYNDHLGNVLRWSGRTDEAAKAYRRALAEWEKLVAAFPAHSSYQCDLADSAYSLCLMLSAAGRPQEAEPFYRRIVQLKPPSSPEINRIAWRLVAHPDPRFRDPGRALELVNESIKHLGSGAAFNTLGVAHYRAGNWKDAIVALEKSMQLFGGAEESFNTFFLAMCHWRLGDKAQACEWYNQAVRWMEKNQPRNEIFWQGTEDFNDELRRFRAEAAALLGIKDQPAANENETTKAKLPDGKGP